MQLQISWHDVASMYELLYYVMLEYLAFMFYK